MTGADRLAQAVLSRPEGQGLLTVCNHVSALDDPLVLAAAVPAETLLHPDKMRWTMCAAERCFHKKLLGSMLKSAKVLPIERGAGLDQPGVLAAERRLARGDWVHIFPEGTRAADPGRLGIVRRGVGRLYVEAAERARGEPSGSGRAPLLLPFVHKGMERINTRGKAGLGVGNDVSVLVGEPIDIEQLLQSAHMNRTRLCGAFQPSRVTTPLPHASDGSQLISLGCQCPRCSHFLSSSNRTAAMESRGATREELYEAVADEVAHALLVLHGNLFGYDPEPAYRRHRAAAEASGAVGRALFSAAAAAGTWGAAAETFPHERRVSGFAASASNAAWRGQQQLLQQRGAIGGAPSALMQTSEDGERGAGAPPAGGFFAPPQDDLWWLAKAQALQRVGRGVAPPPPFAAASILSAAADARC